MTEMINTPSVELIRDLWTERFMGLVLPEDFIEKWLPRRTCQVIGAFNNIENWYRKNPGKTALDVARMICGDLMQNRARYDGIKMSKGPADEGVFIDLWNKYFPQHTVHQYFLDKWVRDKRSQPDASEAFRVVYKLLTEAKVLQDKDAWDIFKLISTKLRHLNNKREEATRSYARNAV